jgi:hypothetical protein
MIQFYSFKIVNLKFKIPFLAIEMALLDNHLPDSLKHICITARYGDLLSWDPVLQAVPEQNGDPLYGDAVSEDVENQ